MTLHPAALWRGYTKWVRRLPEATAMMFAARSRWERSVKIALFGVGVVLPLGSAIWALLFWHGSNIRQHGTSGEHTNRKPPANLEITHNSGTSLSEQRPRSDQV